MTDETNKYNDGTDETHLQEKGLKFACTDIGNAKRFVAHHGCKLRYLWEERRWIAWDGARWKSCEKVYDLAEQTVRRIYNEARDCKNTQGQRELSAWAHKSQAKAKIDPMLSLASNSLSLSVTDFDNDPDVINCSNGLVDLRSGQLKPHDPSQLVMKRVKAAFDLNANCPRWLHFLDDVFHGDTELISYMQRALGYSLTGRTNEHCLFIAYGLGANGKTTLFETVLEILGDYGRVTDFALFLNSDKSDARKQEAIGRLRGTRIAIASETESTRSWKEAVVKKLTGGDTLTGTKLYGSSYEFQPTHTLWFQANHLPGVKDASYGFWRRVRVIPFRAKFEGAKLDAELRSKLLEERDGILKWLVDGARTYLESGLGQIPKACEDATSEYRASNDVLGRFISECLRPDASESVAVSATYEKYQLWSMREKENTIPLNYFSKGMEERGVIRKVTNRGKVFVGYGFARDARDVPTPSNDNWRSPAAGFYVYDGPRQEPRKSRTIEDILSEIDGDNERRQSSGR